MLKIKFNEDKLALLHIFRIGGAMQFHKNRIVVEGWNNIRFNYLPYPKTSDHITVGIRKGLPYDNDTFDAIYCCHVSEHLTMEENIKFCKELYRVLKPKGVCRLSTPDLESKSIDYLKQYEAYKNDPTEQNRIKYYWAVNVLIDQMARVRVGGEMLTALHQKRFDVEHVKETHGDVFRSFYADNMPSNIKFKKNIAYYWNGVKRRIITKFSKMNPALTLENEKYYFDRVSYTKLVEDTGFTNIDNPTFDTSRIPTWNKYQLDNSEFGDYALEPSIFVEGIKP